MPLVIWIAGGVAPLYLVQDQASVPHWSITLTITGLAVSMVVNAVVTSLIVFRIFKVFQEVKPTPDERILGATGRSKLRPTIFILIESGMILFSIQLVRLVVVSLVACTSSTGSNKADTFIIGIHEMLTVSIGSDISTFYFVDNVGQGITPTIILVRASMGLSFHDENSMIEASTRSLQFAPINDRNSSLDPNTESPSIVDQERRDGDLQLVGINGSDIQMADQRDDTDSMIEKQLDPVPAYFIFT